MNEYKAVLKQLRDCFRSQIQWVESNPTAAYFAMAAIIINAYCLFDNGLAAWIAVALVGAYLLIDFRKGVFFWCGCGYFLYNIHTAAYAVSVGLLVFRFVLYMMAKEIALHKYVRSALLTVAALIVPSFVLGVESRLLSAGLLFSNVLIFTLFITVFPNRKDAEGFVDAFYISAFIFLGVMLHSIILNGLDFSERLRFEGNVRDLANSLVLATFFWAVGVITDERQGSIIRPVQDLIGISSAGLLVLTLSKGAILAMVLGLLIYCILAKRLNKRFWMLAGVAVAGVAILQMTGLVDFSRFLERNYDLNGRTRIWSFYFEKTTERGVLGVLFGLGPGNVKRVAVGDYLGKYYVHSTILDFYFSYGVVGFSAFLGYLGLMVHRAIKAKNALALGLLLFACASFSITGASTNTQLFVIFSYIWIIVESDLSDNSRKVIP